MRSFWVFSCFGLMAVMYLIYQSIKWGAEEHKWQEWFFKGAAAAMSALLAGSGYFSRPAPERLMILIGLCVFAAADVILDRAVGLLKERRQSPEGSPEIREERS